MTVTVFQQANQLLREGKLEDAVIVYQKAIAQNPNFYLSHHNLGEVLWKLGQLDEAEKEFRKAIQLKPSASLSYSSLAQVLKQLGKLEEAKKFDPYLTDNQTESVKINNPSVPGENKEQLLTVQPIVKVKTKDSVPVNPPNQSVPEQNVNTETIDPQTAEYYFQQAQSKAEVHNWEEAIPFYRQAILLNPVAAYFHRLGFALAVLQQWEEAIVSYSRAAELNPNSPDVQFHLGYALQEFGLSEEAVAAYHRALELKPEWVDVQNTLDALQRKQEGLENWLLPKTPQPNVQLSLEKPKQKFNELQPSQTYKIGIKTSVPNLSESHVWGDFHFAHALKRAFERQGHYVHVDCQDTWASNLSDDDDIVIVLRGRHGYQPKKHQINLLWLISHPDRIPQEEFALFDHVFVASKYYAEKLSQQVNVPVSCMYQCTDIDLFYPAYPTNLASSEILFVGNSRNVFRPIVRDVIDLNLDVAVYGTLWEKFIDSKYIKGTHIPNDQLHKYYSKCQILLNDHWDTMREEGFLSNRLFDASACGTFIISDAVKGLEEVLGDCIEIYHSPQELKHKILYYKNNPDERQQKAKKAQTIVIQNHSFDNRAKQFIDCILKIQKIRQNNPNSITLLNPTETIKIYNLSKKADVIQQQYFYSNVTGLANGLRATPSSNQPIFYEYIWQLSRQTKNYPDLITELISSENQLINLLSIAKFPAAELPIVSIIMPTYNRSYIIAEGIQSIIEQTYDNWELFVCDDGSTDNTRAIVEQFQDPRIHYLQLKKANGSVARNVGLRFSKGKYIAYLDSDNLWHPQYLWICIQTLEKHPYSMCCYTGYLDTEYNRARLELKNLCYKPFDYYQLVDRNFIDLNSFVHRRSLYEWIGGFDESLVRLQDWDLVLRYTFFFQPLMIKNYLVFYRRSTAWNQVTKLFSHLDVRSLVQNKILSAVEKGQLSLTIPMSSKPKISILTSNQTLASWLKSLAIAKVLSQDFEVQLLVLLYHSDSTNVLKPEEFNGNIEWLNLASVKEYTSLTELMKNPAGFNLIHPIIKKITGDILFTTDCSLGSIAIITALRSLDNKPLIMDDNLHNQLLKHLHQSEETRLQDNVLAANLESSFQGIAVSSSFSFRKIATKLKEHMPTLIREMGAFNKDYLQAIPVKPIVLDLTAKPLQGNNNKYKSQLGFQNGDITIGFLCNSEFGLIKHQILDFQEQVKNYQVKILVLQDLSQANISPSNQQSLDLASEHIKFMKATNQKQMIEMMKGTDLCILWQEDEWVDVNSSQIPLSFVYALVAGAIPVCEPRGEFIEWAECKYCLTIEAGNWDKLAELCIEFRHYSKRIAKMKANGRRLYNMKFSQTVTRENLKYVVNEAWAKHFKITNN